MRPGVSTDTGPTIRVLVGTVQRLEEAGRNVLFSPAAENVATTVLLALATIATAEEVIRSFGLSEADVKDCTSHADIVQVIVSQR